MLTEIIWWVGACLQLLLLLRGIQGKWLKRFPFFYSYNLFVFLEGLLLFVLYHWIPRWYSPVYWNCEFVAVVLGSLVLFEIYRVTLRPYPGTARMARNLLFFVFAVACAKVVVNLSNGAAWWPAKDLAELERNLRTVQSFAILSLIIVIVLYAIPRNLHLKGVLAGYGLFVTNSIVQLSLLSYLGESFQRVVVYIQPFSYDIVLCIWVVTLWSPAKDQSVRPSMEHIPFADHPTLVSRTKRDLQHIQQRLSGAVRR